MVCVPEEDIEVVISGIGGYFPRTKNVEELTKLLMDQVDGIDTARWKLGKVYIRNGISEFDDLIFTERNTLNVCDRTGNMDMVDLFDSSFFGIHRQQALFMDPMARMVLQNTMEALIDAGSSPATIRGRRVLVAAASCLSENDSLMFESVENGFGVTGQARTMMANRISYWLHTTGPSYSTDSSWLGGLQVLQHGYDAIRTGQCEAAIVVAANLVMNIYTTHHFKQFGTTSPDGATRAFDDNADGCGRSDGTCVLFLQRSDQARRKYATVVNVEAIYNGYREGIFVNIDPDFARNFLTNFYQKAQVDPSEISYLEAHGSATKNLDTIELNLVDRVFNNDKREQPLMIGSVKTNIGHTEACSFLTSIVKTLIAMEKGIIPGNLHYKTPNLQVPALTEGRLKVVSENTPWSGQYAAVNGFGVSSSFGHLLLRKNDIEMPPNTEELAKKLPLLHVVATRTEDGIKEIVEQISNNKVLNLDYVNLINNTFTDPIPGYLCRGYVIKNGDTIKSECANFGGINRPVWFVYSGMGSQWLTMGKQLLDLPIFAKAVDKCVKALQPFDIDLMHILTSEDKDIFDNILHSFVGIAAVQIGLTDLLFSLNITPDGIVGHSVGELGCAYADGCLTAEQMILSAYYRGRASLEAELIPGLMAAVGLGATEAAKYVTSAVDIACHNGPESCTLSGPKEDMEKLVALLQGKGIFARLVNVAGIAYHSRYIQPAAPLLLSYLQKLIPKPKARSSKWLSTSVPEARWHTDLAKFVSADYLTNNLLSSVCFEETLKFIPKEAVLIEIAPHGLLQAILKRSVDAECVNIGLTKRGINNAIEFLFTAIGKMYISGIPMNLSSLYKDIYPGNQIVPRGTPFLASLVRWAHAGDWRTGMNEFLDCSNSEQTYNVDTHSEWCRDVTGHKVFNTCLIPLTAYLPLVCNIIANIKKTDTVEFLNLSLKRHRSIPLKEVYIPPVRLMVQRGTGSFEISDRYGVIASGQSIVPDPQQAQLLIKEITEGNVKDNKLMGEKLYKLSKQEIYGELAARGLELHGAYKTISELHIYKNGVEAFIEWNNKWPTFMSSILHTVLLHPTSSTRCLIPGFVRRMIVHFENLPREGTVLPVRYIGSTDTFWSPIMVIQSARSIAPIEINRPTLVGLKTMFIPQEVKNNEEIDVATIVDASLEVIRRQLGADKKVNVIVFNDSITRPVRNIINEAIKQNSAPQVQLHTINTFATSELNTVEANLVVVSSDHISSISQYVKNHPKCHVLVCSDHKSKNESDLIEILSYQKDGYYMRLLKKMCNEQVKVINIKERIISEEDLENTSLVWVRDLQTQLSSNSKERIYVACRSLPVNDVNSFVSTIQNLKNGHRTRFIFVLDERAPNVTSTESFYSRIFQEDVTIAVYERLQWGSRYSSTVRLTEKDLNKDENQNDQEDEYSLKVKVNNVDVKYIGVHASGVVPVENNNKSGPVSNLGLIDYCGYKKGSNTRVMGICDASLKADNIFQWTITDEEWTLVDGATIPAAYALAYYTLGDLTRLEAGESVLVHNACSAFGQAMIRVAYSIGAKIFASVATDRQRSLLLQHMRMLNTDIIFDYTTAKFEQQVMEATQGQGVSVLVNCMKGDRLRAGLRCIADLSRVVLLQNDTDEVTNPNTDTIGLSAFFRCVGMYGVHPAKLCDLDEHTKRRIHQFVHEGLVKGHIMPIRRNIFRHQEPIQQIIRYVTGPQVTGSAIIPIQEENIQNPQTPGFHCSSTKAYVVHADDTTDISTICVTLSWLARHGAKKILLKYTIKNNEERAFLQRHLQGFNVCVEMASTLPVPEKLQNVAAVIVLSGVKTIAQNDVPPGVRLVIITGTKSPLMLPIPPHPLRSTLRRSREIQFDNVLNFLSYALSQTVDMLIHSDEGEGDQIVEENFTFKDFFRLLGASVPSILSVKTKPVDDVSFEIANTSSPKKITDTVPVFVIPGLVGSKCKYLQHVLQRILSPVYIVNAQSHNNKTEQLSALIAQRIREVYPKGRYSIMGVSTGGILALEVTKHLEDAVGSTNVQLYLIDGAPATIQHLMNEAQTSTLGLDGLILQDLLQIDQYEVISDIIAHNKSWQTRLNAALGLFEFTRAETQTITERINMIRNNVHKILNYTPNEHVLNASVRLLRPRISSKDRSNTLLKTCKHLKVEVVNGNHFSMLKSRKLAECINDNIIMPLIYT